MPAQTRWYHCNGNTHGTWLRGDPRGWRARHHREHVEGDYRNPPAPGAHDRERRASERLMTRPPVRLSAPARRRACEVFVGSLSRHGAEVGALSIDDHHFHLLVRLSAESVRRAVGMAKKDSARALSEEGFVEQGGVWAVRFRALPVRDRAHQVNVARYIAAHERRGASVWLAWREGRAS